MVRYISKMDIITIKLNSVNPSTISFSLTFVVVSGVLRLGDMAFYSTLYCCKMDLITLGVNPNG